MDPTAEQAVVSRIITTIFTSDLKICVDASWLLLVVMNVQHRLWYYGLGLWACWVVRGLGASCFLPYWLAQFFVISNTDAERAGPFFMQKLYAPNSLIHLPLDFCPAEFGPSIYAWVDDYSPIPCIVGFSINKQCYVWTVIYFGSGMDSDRVWLATGRLDGPAHSPPHHGLHTHPAPVTAPAAPS
jgi:hypothetical protein